MIAKEYSWIPFHVVACNSEEYGTQADLLATQKFATQRSWESSRTGQFPVELAIRFHYRAEVSHILIGTKNEKNIPEVVFHIGDGFSGSFLDAEYRIAGKYEYVFNKPQQIPLQGIGNYFKIIIPKPPKRSPENPFSQVSIAVLKIWGRYTNYMSKIKNEVIPIVKEQKNVDQILIGLGIPVDMLGWFEDDARTYENAPIDEDTRITLRDMVNLKERALGQEDFEGLKALAEDIKKVFEIGREIWNLRRELNFAIAKEDYSRAIELKNRLRNLEGKRDGYDALYETSRYEQMVVLNRPSTADYNRALQMMDDEESRDAEARRRKKELEEKDRKQIVKQEQEKVQVEEKKQVDVTPWWEKQKDDTKVIQKKKKKKEEVKSDSVDVDRFKNPFAFNEGDVDLDLYLKPLLSNAGVKVPEIPAEILRRLQNLGYLTVFGARVWCCIHSDNWRLREAAAQAVLNFIEMPLPDKYLNGKSKKLFLASMEMARISTEDKILQIYFIGLKILSTALAPPVCGTDVSPAVINKVLAQFVPILISKIEELNFRARDISMHTLLSVFKHPAAHVGMLVQACLNICIEDPNFSSLYVPPDKQPQRIMMARLEIVLNVIQELGYDEREWKWEEVFQFMCIPCLFHPNNDVRMVAIELAVNLYQFIGEDIRNGILSIDNLKPNTLEIIINRMDAVKDIAEKNQKEREGKKGDLIQIDNQGASNNNSQTLTKSVKIDLPKIKEDKDEDKDDQDKNKLKNNSSTGNLQKSK